MTTPPALPVEPFLPIPWQPFRDAFRRQLDPTVLCLWWVPVRGTVEVFTGRVTYWHAADAALVCRKTGSMVRVSDGCFFAIVTAPPAVPQLDDAINVSAGQRAESGSIATPEPRALAPAAEPPADP